MLFGKKLEKRLKYLEDKIARHTDSINDLENYLHHIEREDSAHVLEQKVNDLYCKSEGLTVSVHLYNSQQDKYEMTISFVNFYNRKENVFTKIGYVWELQDLLKKGDLGMCEIERAISAWKWQQEHSVTVQAVDSCEYTTVSNYMENKKETKKKK